MKLKYIRLSVLTIVLLWSTHVNVDAQSTKEKIRKCFSIYQAEMLEKNAVHASQYFHQNTTDIFSKTLELVKSADSLTLEHLEIVDKFLVLSLRHKIEKNSLLNMTSQELLMYAIHEATSCKSFASFELGKIRVKKEYAEADIYFKDKKMPAVLTFRLDNERWLMDLSPMFAQLKARVKSKIVKMGNLEQFSNPAFLLLLEMSTGKKPSSDIWKPLK